MHLRAVVTYYDPYIDPRHPTVWVSDRSGGIYVELSSVPAVPFKAGDLLELTGVSAAGGYAPIVKASAVRVLGRSPLPSTPAQGNLRPNTDRRGGRAMGGSRGCGACGPGVWKKHRFGSGFGRRHHNYRIHRQGSWDRIITAWSMPKYGFVETKPRCSIAWRDDGRLPALSGSRPGTVEEPAPAHPLSYRSRQSAVCYASLRNPLQTIAFTFARLLLWPGLGDWSAFRTAPRTLRPDRPGYSSEAWRAGRLIGFPMINAFPPP